MSWWTDRQRWTDENRYQYSFSLSGPAALPDGPPVMVCYILADSHTHTHTENHTKRQAGKVSKFKLTLRLVEMR